MDFKKHLAFHYGNLAKMGESFANHLAKYEAVEHKSPAVLARIASYKRMIETINQAQAV